MNGPAWIGLTVLDSGAHIDVRADRVEAVVRGDGGNAIIRTMGGLEVEVTDSFTDVMCWVSA